MYILPDDFDVQLLSGCYLEMICFGPSVTKLDFSRPQTTPGLAPYKVSFCVEAGLSYQLGGTSGRREFSDPATCASLISFLLKDVMSVTRVGSASLELSFGDVGNIMIEADCDAEFESYSIYLNSGDVIFV
ncbi:hypothetical protein [Paraherbaspirillum soli]|uniref:Uncharacterized protein n=1 Tax=Paraherbaspirillum soli TaxID=631222 RepID=A0ABW0M5J9_9BURK